MFLARASDFFASDIGAAVGNYLLVGMDSRNNTFTTHSLVLCVVLEGLARFFRLQQDVPSDDASEPPMTPDREQAVKTALIDAGFSERKSRRIVGWIKGMDKGTSGKNSLNDLAAEGIVVTPEDVKAWTELRNKPAHGHLLMTEEDAADHQSYIDCICRVSNLINKLLLQAIGYEGPYFDYTTWSRADFKPSTRVALALQ